MALTKIGKYDVLRSLGKGPSGESYLAEDRGNGHRVVIRLLEGNDSLVEQARRVAALSHPNLGLGQVGLQGGTPFFATEHFAGATLADWISGNPTLPERLKAVEALADALAHVHEQGVVHGALEPSAVRITDDGDCKLTDFEFGGTRDEPASTAYRPPEVLQGNAYTQRSEIHAAGVLFYEALVGKNPFQRGTPAATKEAVLNEQPQQLAEARKDVPRDLADAIMACFEKDPDWRPKDLSYVLEVVRRSGGSKKIAARKTAAAPAGSTRTAAPTFSAVGGRRRSSSRAPLFAALAAGAVALAAAGWFLLGPGAHGTERKTASAPSTTLAAPKPVEAPAAEATPTAAAPSPAARMPSPTAAASAKPAAKDAQATGRPLEPATAAAPGGAVKVASATPVPEAEVRPVPPPPTTEPPRTASTVGGTAPAADTAAAGGPVPTLPAVAQEPASLRNLAPPVLKRPATTIVDVHGSGLRADHQAVVFKGKEIAPGISVVRQRLVNSGLVQVVLLVDASASPGTYALVFADPRGNSTNPLRFDVAK